MVIVKVPVNARLPTMRVKVLEDAAGFGLKEAVTLPGKPEADSWTFPLKPFEGVMLTVVAPWVPRAMFRLDGEAESVKFGPAAMVSEIVVVLVRLAHVPVTVTLNVPMAAVELAVKVSVLAAVVLPGLKDAATPPGRPDADRMTVPLKPLLGLTLTVLDPLLP